MDPPSPVTDLHSTATATKGDRNEHNTRMCLRGTEAKRVAVGGCPDLNGAACSARTEMERALRSEPDGQRGFGYYKNDM